jgi:tetratricopeptide (TPR) repeat protein
MLATTFVAFALLAPALSGGAKQGDLECALADFDQAIKLSPGYARALYNRGVVHARQGELDRSIAEYTRAIEADPVLARAFNGRGQALLRKADTPRAVADFTEALRIDKSKASARRNLERATAVASAGGVAGQRRACPRAARIGMTGRTA